MTTTFLLIRHGSNDYVGRALAGHIPGVHLNEHGREEAESLSRRLLKTDLKAIYSSPLERAIETAEPLARRLDLPVIKRQRLIEVDFGEWGGSLIADLEDDPRWRKYNAFRNSTSAPQGELMLEIQARVATELEELRADHPDDTIALFSHGDVIKGAVALYAGISLDLFHRIEISPASISVLTLSEWGPQVLTINDTGAFSCL